MGEAPGQLTAYTVVSCFFQSFKPGGVVINHFWMLKYSGGYRGFRCWPRESMALGSIRQAPVVIRGLAGYRIDNNARELPRNHPHAVTTPKRADIALPCNLRAGGF